MKMLKFINTLSLLKLKVLQYHMLNLHRYTTILYSDAIVLLYINATVLLKIWGLISFLGKFEFYRSLKVYNLVENNKFENEKDLCLGRKDKRNNVLF